MRGNAVSAHGIPVERLSFRYDREADILHIDKCAPYAAQESEELDDEIIARLNPSTDEVENLEVLFFNRILILSILSILSVNPLCAQETLAPTD